jgi:glutamate racemase
MKLGMLDSGLGGVCVLKTLHELYPLQDVLCLADQVNAPYGNRSVEDIIDITRKNVRWFADQGIDRLFFACNTTSSVALPVLRNEFPTMEFIDIIKLNCSPLVDGHFKRVLVLATKATVNSRAYTKEINSLLADVIVDELALSELAGLLENDTAEQTIFEYLSDLLCNIDYYDLVILGCTHYPLVKSMIQQFFSCSIIDTDIAISRQFSTFPQTGNIEIVTTGDQHHLSNQIERLLHWSPKVSKVTI